MAATTLAQVEEIARKRVGWKGSLREEDRLVENLGLDSLQRMTLAMEIENHFRICLDPEDEAAIETIGDLVRTIERKAQRGGAQTP